MKARLFWVAALTLFIALLTSAAQAACGLGKTPALSDITAVRFERTGCFGHCPSYQVLFSQLGTNVCEYIGIKDAPKLGTYDAKCGRPTFASVVEAIGRGKFYALSIDTSMLVLDVPHLLIAVERCGVTTRLDWAEYGRPDIAALGQALDQITNSLDWKKKSDSVDSGYLLAPL